MKARASVWLPYLESLDADEQTILVGHSSGAVAAMRYAETHQLLGSVLVSVCHTDLGDAFEAASGYYRDPWQWQRIRENQQWIGIFHSTDDPLIPIAEARHVAAQLKGSYFEFEDRGHFSDVARVPRGARLHPPQARRLAGRSARRAVVETRDCSAQFRHRLPHAAWSTGPVGLTPSGTGVDRARGLVTGLQHPACSSSVDVSGTRGSRMGSSSAGVARHTP